MKPLNFALFALLLVVSAVYPAAAEFYRYVDKHGNILYTDDLSKIPAEQRSKATAYEESKIVEPAPEQKKAGDAPADITQTENSETLKKERQDLQARGDALNQEYDQLMQERSRLDQEKEQAVTNDQIRTYNQKIVDFNSRIQNYEQRRDAYSVLVKEFNDRAAPATAKQPKP